MVVHGIWDDARTVMPLVRALSKRGLPHVSAIELTPPWGTATIEELAAQLALFVARQREQHGAEDVDVVGFSMGALVTHAYLKLLAGHAHVKTFVSISGPHRGTLTAYALPLRGVRQMRPGSALLKALGDDVSQLASVAVHCLYTPFDSMIVPSESSILRGARSVHRIAVPLHQLMVRDARVHTLVGELLTAHSAAK